MINKSKLKEPMNLLDEDKRIHTFEEVEKGYNDMQAIKESERCLKCKNSPCVKGCPIGIKIPEFINSISQQDFKTAYEIISKDNFLPSICGRVCPQEKQCEAMCVRGKTGQPVAIGSLERYIGDKFKHLKPTLSNVKLKIKVAVIGSGPSGLTCAGELCALGYEVNIFEALHTPGGVLTYGIPPFRLPRNILNLEIQKLKEMGVKIINNVVIGKTLSLDDLFEMGYSAVYLSVGAGLPKFMGIPGEGLSGVCSANEFLTRINLMNAYKADYDTPLKIPSKILIVGGGNVAMDAARSAVRIGCREVMVMYRRTQEEMPARKAEVLHAKEEGVKFLFLKTPLEFKGENGILNRVKYAKMNYSGIDKNGRKSFTASKDEFYEMEIDGAIISIGNNANKLLFENENDISFEKDGRIKTNNSTRTSRKYVYAGGDVVTGAATVILAMEAGKRAAKEIHEDLSL